ncbi:protoporphyrinogen oxidase HemJ [Kiloniella laminariae]|uniref:Protoporphyrinogen IX oxidase n=1 Tax=Kiloniella laminariae TaxID=454162 RepID=A0ABT4LJ94_9PROT|nr:protoporphyrinogen oxidase HemJ [Kiloniella laminariae]MCZ4281180.1 protoporphyrinogen oxidase HemJ [Kiloniella laminariae]
MGGFLGDFYLWVKAIHIMAVISWMAGLFYLPRLFVYHTQVPTGSERSEIFKVMERKLFRFIMTPAMAATWIFGILLVLNIEAYREGWFHGKLVCLLGMQAFHGMSSKWMKNFQSDINVKSEKFFRLANEVPTLLMIAIVILAVVKPF